MDTSQPLVEQLAAVWGSIDELCSSLDDREWELATDCPGWTVKDQLSHVIATETVLLGRPIPEHAVADAPHVRNDIGRFNEVLVDLRRPVPPAELLLEFREVTGARLEALRRLAPEDYEQETWTPAGPGPVRTLLELRAFDCWVHEQDIRRATHRPGHLEGPAVRNALDRIVDALGFVVGKRARAPEGATVVFDVTGAEGRVVAVGVVDGRGKVLDVAPEQPTSRLTMDVETFAVLGAGRLHAATALAGGRVRIDGDGGLGRAVVEGMAFVP